MRWLLRIRWALRRVRRVSGGPIPSASSSSAVTVAVVMLRRRSLTLTLRRSVRVQSVAMTMRSVLAVMLWMRYRSGRRLIVAVAAVGRLHRRRNRILVMTLRRHWRRLIAVLMAVSRRHSVMAVPRGHRRRCRRRVTLRSLSRRSCHRRPTHTLSHRAALRSVAVVSRRSTS